MPRSPKRLVAFVIILSAVFCTAAPGGELTLKSGFRLTGEPIKRSAIILETSKFRANSTAYPLMTVEDGVRRYYVSAKLVDRNSVDDSENLSLETFEFPHRDPSGKAPTALSAVPHDTPFGPRGRRALPVQTPFGEKNIEQVASYVTPEFVEITTLNLDWTYGLLTSELSDETLLSLVDQAIDPTNPSDRISKIAFLAQARRFEPARAAMAAFQQEFPGQTDRALDFEQRLDESYGVRALSELRRLRDAGQHVAVIHYATILRDSDRVSVDTSERAFDVLDEYTTLTEQRDTVFTALEQLESELATDDAALVAPLRPQLIDELHADTIARLESFLKSVEDSTLSASEKLALAYSAWVAGPDAATTELLDAVDFWRLREAVLAYVRANGPIERSSQWTVIEQIEGVDILDLQAIIPLLPAITVPPERPSTETEEAGEPSETGNDSSEQFDEENPFAATVSFMTASGVAYDVRYPPEYSPARDYPVLIALHDRHRGPGQELAWWAGTAMKQGYVIVAPDYLGGEPPSGTTHDRIIDVLKDVRRQFRVDSDRVFLVGHGLGGDVVLDLGLARPMPWAGLVAINGMFSQAAKRSWENGRYVPIYAVNGTLDPDAFEGNARTLQNLMFDSQDVVLCEYVNRGRESYAAEQERIFEWMALHQRRPLPREIDGRVFHYTDTDWDWIRYEPSRKALIPQRPGKPPAGQRVYAVVTPGGSLRTLSQPAALWLTPAMIDFDKRLKIKYGSRSLKPSFVKPSMRDMLDDFADRADRQRLFWLKLVVP